MTKLSVTIITRNEEHNLPRALESVRWADEVIVLDSHSTDRTADIACQFGAKVFQCEWPGFGAAKQAAANYATNDWVLSLDADEAVTPELAQEMQNAITNSDGAVGFYIPRRTNFLGRWIKHCGWYPDYVLRLFRKPFGRFDEAIVHERVLLDGPTGCLHGELLHYSYPNLELYFSKMNRYTSLGAEEAFQQGKRAGMFDLAARPCVTFIKHYVSKRGFLDGTEGFLLSALSAMAVMTKYAKLRQLQRTRSGKVN